MADDLFQQIDPEDEIQTPDVKYEDLVGEGKKYVDNDTVAKALVHKDSFIEQLKRENAEARKALQERINMEQFLAKLEAAKAPTPKEPPTPGDTSQEKPASAVTHDDIARMLEEREAKSKREANLRTVEDKLRETLGSDYKRRVQEKALALKVDTKWLTDVASRNPDAFYELMGLNRQQPADGFSPPPRSALTAPPSQSNKKDYAYWQKVLREKGEGHYFSIPVQQERWKALQEMGEQAFYGKK